MSEVPSVPEGIPLNASVHVQRSSGEIEEGWVVFHYFEWPEGYSDNLWPAGTPVATVIKPATETSEELRKDVSVKELLSWQPEVEGEGSSN